MSAEEVDEYLRGVEEPKRSVLQTLRDTILEIVPEAEQAAASTQAAARRTAHSRRAGQSAPDDL